jgi:hypothetical protein
MQMVENLLRQGKALSSNPSIDCQSKKKKSHKSIRILGANSREKRYQERQEQQEDLVSWCWSWRAHRKQQLSLQEGAKGFRTETSGVQCKIV